jgi:hypothetical protein
MAAVAITADAATIPSVEAITVDVGSAAAEP